MSLRKSPQLTPELVEAFRRNAQHATGPRSPAGKENVKMNALKHGFYSAAQNHQIAMLALGEDPQEFEALERELFTTYGPGDALWRRQIEDLAKLYWRRGRLERMQTGVMRRALQEVEEGQHRRELEVANATFDPSHPEMLEIATAESSDPGVRLRRILSSLGVIRARVAQDPLSGPPACPIGPVAQTSASEVCGSSSGPGTSRGPQDRGCALPGVLENLYRGMMGWRVARICRLLRLLSDSSDVGAQQKGATPQAGETELQELLRLLDEEIAAVQQEFEYAEKVNAEKAAIERDACLAPAGETWRMMLRQESALDRSIDRKVKIVLGLRKLFLDDSLESLIVRTGSDEGNDPEMEEIAPTLGIDIPSEDPATLAPPELQKSGNKPGMSMKTKGCSPKEGSEPGMYQTTTNLDGNGGNASRNAAA